MILFFFFFYLQSLPCAREAEDPFPEGSGEKIPRYIEIVKGDSLSRARGHDFRVADEREEMVFHAASLGPIYRFAVQ